MEVPSSLKNASILVTGSTGMLGRELVGKFSAANRVDGVSKSGRENSLVCDLRREKDVEKLFSGRWDLVIHAAAYSDVDGCERDPKLAHESNGLAAKNLAAACRKAWTPLIYVSTDYVFDGQKKTPYLENDATFPVNIYGMTKLEGEHYTRGLAPFGAVVRTSWLFGPGNPANFVNAIVARLQTEKKARVLDDQEDSPTFVADLATALEKIGARLIVAARDGKPFFDVFHVCNEGSATRYQIALKIKECLRLEAARVEKSEPGEISGRLARRPRYAVMSTAYFRRSFGLPLRPWQESLTAYLSGIISSE